MFGVKVSCSSLAFYLGAIDFCLTKTSRPSLGSTQASVQWVGKAARA